MKKLLQICAFAAISCFSIFNVSAHTISYEQFEGLNRDHSLFDSQKWRMKKDHLKDKFRMLHGKLDERRDVLRDRFEHLFDEIEDKIDEHADDHVDVDKEMIEDHLTDVLDMVHDNMDEKWEMIDEKWEMWEHHMPPVHEPALATPIPAAFWLFASGIMGLAGFFRSGSREKLK